MERGWKQGNVRSDDGIMARIDCDFRSVVTPSKLHSAFGHFESGGVTADKQSERGSHNDCLGIRRDKDEWPIARLFLKSGLKGAMFQAHAARLVARIVERNDVAAEVELRAVAKCDCSGTVQPEGAELLAGSPRFAACRQMVAGWPLQTHFAPH